MGSIPIRHPIEKSSNGRTPPFEGVYLGSSPSFSASWIGVTVARWSPKPLVGVQISHPSPTLLAQWTEHLTTDQGAVGSNPTESVRNISLINTNKKVLEWNLFISHFIKHNQLSCFFSGRHGCFIGT